MGVEDRQVFVEGPRSIVFGQEELARLFRGGGSDNDPKGVHEALKATNALGGAPPQDVNRAIKAMRDIKNDYLNQRNVDAAVDDSVMTIQYLAIFIGDAEHAVALRDLRDELVLAVQQSFFEIRNKHLNSSARPHGSRVTTLLRGHLPFMNGVRRPKKRPHHVKWAVHHQKTFRDIISDSVAMNGTSADYLPDVQAASKKCITDKRTKKRFEEIRGNDG